MSRSKEEIENMKKKEEIHKLNDKNMNIFKKIITQKITVESEDEDDEKKEKNNLGKLNQNIIENSKNINNSENIEEKKREKEEEKKDNKKEEKNNLKNEEKKEETKPNLLLFGQSTSTNQSLFGTIGNNNTNNNNSTSLFGNKNNNNSTSIFSNTNNNNSTSLFGNNNNNNSTSIFSNTNNNNSTSLFGNKDNEKKEENNSNSFSHIFKQGNLFKSTLFSNLEKPELTFSGFKNTNSFFTENNDKKEENEEEENELFNEEEENKPKSEKPKPLVSQDFSNYDKKYNNHIDNFYVFSRITKKYVSKGNGFLSVEISKDKNKKSSVIVFRNQGGNKLVEGFIISNLSKIKTEEKNYKNIAIVYYLSINNLGKKEISVAKIPFSNIELFQNFKKAFEDSIKYVQG